MITEQMVQFVDEGIQNEVKVSVAKDSFSEDTYAPDTMLGSWLERPLEIANFSWSTGSEFSQWFDPWTLFLEDPRNINKIAYYNNLSCDHLCIKILINGGPFYAGRLMASYLPFDGTSSGTLSDNMSYSRGGAPLRSYALNTHSHRPHILLDPTLSQGGCFELPFLWNKTCIEIPKNEWQQLGSMTIQSFGELSTAGGASTATVKIKVFAWMVKPVLSVPTTSLPVLPAQSTAGDEYVGLVSKPATAVAKIAGRMLDFPIVGQYARATQIGASGLASVAKMLGFSRPNILAPITPMRPTYVNDLAVTDKPEYVIKITTDSKQELSISPFSIGVEEGDVYSISNMVGRETFLCSCIWSTEQVEGYNLFSSLVNPMLYAVGEPEAGLKQMFSTAMSFGSLPFRWWRGNVKFRFQLVASQFHRGRVKLVYDFAAAPISSKSNSVYSKIIDVQETTEFTIVVGWNNPALMAEVHRTDALEFEEKWANNSISFAPDVKYDNGSLSLFVENELQVPIPGIAAPAQWLVWVSLENPVFNEPCNKLQQVTPSPPFTYEATVGEEGPVTDKMEIGNLVTDPNLNQVVFGETITSFRALLRRYSDFVFVQRSGASATLYNNFFMVFRDYPVFPGTDVNGINVTSTAETCNFVSMSLLSYLSMSHSAYRGGIRYKFHNLTSTGLRPMEFIRYPTLASSTNLSSASLGAVNVADSYSAAAASLGNAWIGAGITDCNRNPFLEVEAPFWTNLRFQNPKHFNNNDVEGQAHELFVSPQSGNTALVLKVYIAAAEDFQVGMYTGPPVLWLSSYNVY